MAEQDTEEFAVATELSAADGRYRPDLVALPKQKPESE